MGDPNVRFNDISWNQCEETLNNLSRRRRLDSLDDGLDDIGEGKGDDKMS